MKKFFLWLGGIMLAVLVIVIATVYIGASAWMDDNYPHSKATATLPRFESSEALALASGTSPSLSLITAGDFKFRARTAGFGNRKGNVILLHGFPESSIMYSSTIADLARAGYQVVAFDQRGYSPGARPKGVDAYTTDHLMQDVLDVADAVGFDNFHLVGHDWGAVVGWLLVMADNPRIISWSALSIPHMGAYAEAMANDSDQQSRSGYVGFFQTPWLPEAVFSYNDFALMKNGLYAQHSPDSKAEYLAIFSEPGALTSALNWYRASGLALSATGKAKVTIPTAYIWGNEDEVVGPASLAAQEAYFDGNLTKTELNTGHWLTETMPQPVNEAVRAHIERNSR